MNHVIHENTDDFHGIAARPIAKHVTDEWSTCTIGWEYDGGYAITSSQVYTPTLTEAIMYLTSHGAISDDGVAKTTIMYRAKKVDDRIEASWLAGVVTAFDENAHAEAMRIAGFVVDDVDIDDVPDGDVEILM